MNLRTFSTESEWVETSVHYLQSLAQEKSHLAIALAGGNTPRGIYTAWGQLEEKNQIHFFELDERYLPHDHSNSNYRMIAETLVPKHFSFFDTSLPITESLERYEAILQPFDLCVIGIGPDGHIASLFPYSGALKEKRLVAHTTTDQFAGHDRLTLTFPAILQSKHIIVLLKGADKQFILNELEHPTKTTEAFPALKLLEHSDLTILFAK